MPTLEPSGRAAAAIVTWIWRWEMASFTWHFTEPGQTRFGCHLPGHYAAGMYGTITVSEPV
jgi:hypothetical protein